MATTNRTWRKRILLAGVLTLIAFWAYELLAVRGTFAPSRPASAAGGSAIVTGISGHRIAGRVYLAGTAALIQPLVVILHGDAPFVNPGYQYTVAAELAAAAPGTRVVALLRPGYADPYGAKSDGDRGFASGENYTLEVIGDMAAAIQSLKLQWSASAVMLVGHSGGAAVAANIAALHPGLARQIFLVSCPCDVPAFRWHMARLHWSPMWLRPVHSLSPLQTLEQMSKEIKITAISGASDPIALPQYARAYMAKAEALGISAVMITLPEEGHEILTNPAVINRIAKAVRSSN